MENKPTESGKMEDEATGANGFDFLIGSWRVHHCRLKERLADNHGWIEFEGTCAMQKILGGAGNMDENVLDFPGGAYRAVSLRTYDATKKQWSIWWIDARNPSHLDPPVVGGFKNGIGTFYANDTFKGKPIRFASCGRISPPNRIGSRRSPTMEAKRGKLTGSWNS